MDSKLNLHAELSGLHILLTYQCNFECDHCFTWGSPWQSGTLSLDQIDLVLKQAAEIPSLRSIYFEGGEPFLYYPILLSAVQKAARAGYEVGLVSNAYWALSDKDAIEWLRPFAGLLSDLSVSSDYFHYDEFLSSQAQNACRGAQSLGIPCGVISIASADTAGILDQTGRLRPNPEGESTGVMYRGRAALKLSQQALHYSWDSFDNCPHENLADPGRIHLDPLGYLHVCQGITIGNLFERPLKDIWADFSPHTHPIIAPLLEGGPSELRRQSGAACAGEFADACHLCYSTRLEMRAQYPELLAPAQMYGDYLTSR